MLGAPVFSVRLCFRVSLRSRVRHRLFCVSCSIFFRRYYLIAHYAKLHGQVGRYYCSGSTSGRPRTWCDRGFTTTSAVARLKRGMRGCPLGSSSSSAPCARRNEPRRICSATAPSKSNKRPGSMEAGEGSGARGQTSPGRRESAAEMQPIQCRGPTASTAFQLKAYRWTLEPEWLTALALRLSSLQRQDKSFTPCTPRQHNADAHTLVL